MGWIDVERAFNDAVEKGVIPGATVVVRRGADVAFEGAFGFRSIEPTRSPAKIDTVYDLSSLTKAIATTVAVMILARDGKFRLDDRVTRSSRRNLPSRARIITATVVASAFVSDDRS